MVLSISYFLISYSYCTASVMKYNLYGDDEVFIAVVVRCKPESSKV